MRKSHNETKISESYGLVAQDLAVHCGDLWGFFTLNFPKLQPYSDLALYHICQTAQLSKYLIFAQFHPDDNVLIILAVHWIPADASAKYEMQEASGQLLSTFQILVSPITSLLSHRSSLCREFSACNDLRFDGSVYCTVSFEI